MKTFVALILVLVSGIVAVGQTSPELVDEFGRLNCEDLKARIDGLMTMVNTDATSRAVISINPDEHDILGALKFEEMLRGCLLVRRYDATRVQFVRALPMTSIRGQMWRLPAGATGPVTQVSSWDLKIDPERRAFIVDTEWYYGDDICPPVDGIKIVAELLNANPAARAHIVARPGSRFRSKRGREAVLRELQKKYQIARTRIRFFPTTRAKRRTTDSEPDTEIWFVPQ
jgi:hypothetical protein